jgi:hypothetical protein
LKNVSSFFTLQYMGHVIEHLSFDTNGRYIMG